MTKRTGKLNKWEEKAALSCLAKIEKTYGEEFRKIGDAHIKDQLKQGKPADLSTCVFPQHLVDARADAKYYIDMLETHRQILREEEFAEEVKKASLEEALLDEDDS